MDCKSVTRGFDSHSPLAKNAGYPEKVTSVFLLGLFGLRLRKADLFSGDPLLQRENHSIVENVDLAKMASKDQRK